jgi:eukaryotic-like serine/threonine-protein kinase
MPLSDAALRHLRAMADEPDLSETKYRMVRALGRGGMGTVYLVNDAELDRAVALKVVGLPGAPVASAERLAGEAKILARLEHPSIVPVHDVGVLPDGRTYYAMKFVRGERLDAVLARPTTLLDRLEIFERICDAVAFAHSQGVIHRDLKPENVMVGQFGEVLVLDWGAAAFAAHTEPAAVVGTAGYMSPEQARGEPADERSDVYALGVMLERMLPSPAPRPLLAVGRKAHAENRADRYVTVVELADDLRRYKEGDPLVAYRENVIERIARLMNKYRLPLALVVAYVLMRVLLLLFARD